MAKRSRNLSVKVKKFQLNVITFEWNGKDYTIYGDEIVKMMMSNTEFDCDVIQDGNLQAVLNIERISNGELVISRQINPVN